MANETPTAARASGIESNRAAVATVNAVVAALSLFAQLVRHKRVLIVELVEELELLDECVV